MPAGNVVLTHGAWAARERHFRRAFAVCTDFMVVTEPIPELIEQIGWTSHMGVADLREMLYYLRPTADGRIAIGGGAMGIVCGERIRGRVLTAPRLAAVAARGLIWLFPQLEGVRFDAAWSGPMDITDAALPFFDRRPAATSTPASASPATGSPPPGWRQDPGFPRLREDDDGAGCRSSARRPRRPQSPCAGRSSRRSTRAYEASDRARQQGGRQGPLPRAVIGGYSRYTVLNCATGREGPPESPRRHATSPCAAEPPFRRRSRAVISLDG